MPETAGNRQGRRATTFKAGVNLNIVTQEVSALDMVSDNQVHGLYFTRFNIAGVVKINTALGVLGKTPLP